MSQDANEPLGLLIFGGGSMAQAVTRSAISRGVLSPLRITLCEPDTARREVFDSWGIPIEATTDDHAEAMLRSEPGTPILLAVKPQSFLGSFAPWPDAVPMAALADTLRPLITDRDRPIFSIMAGLSRATIAGRLSVPERSVIRIMPNIAAQVGQSMTAICAGKDADAADVAKARRLFDAVGRTVGIEEARFDAFTALAGSGPAYLFVLAQAMTKAGVESGFSAEAADLITRQTLLGAAGLLVDDPRTPEALRVTVTSQGGTTEAAIRSLEADAVPQAIVRAIVAATERSGQLGQ